MKAVFIKYNILLFLSLFLFIKISHAQVSEFNSTDNTAVFELLDQARDFNDPDSIRTTLNRAYNLANSISDSWAIQRTLAEWSYFEKKQGNLSVALRYALRVIREGENNQEDNQLIHYEMLIQMGDIYLIEDLYDQAKSYYKSALEIIDEDVDLNISTVLYEKIGTSYFLSGQPDSAMIYYEQVEQLHQQNNDEEALIDVYHEIVEQYKNNHTPNQALKYNLKIKDLVEKTNNVGDLATINNNIGYNYSTMGDHEAALAYFKVTKELCKDEKYVNLADLYANIGITYHNLNRLSGAVDYLQRAQKELRKSGDPEQLLAQLHHNLAVIYLNGNDIYNAQISVEKARTLAQSQNNQQLLTSVYATTAEVSEKLYEYENALTFYQRHLTLRDSFLLEDRKRQQDLLQQQFLLNRSEKEIRLLMVQQDIQKLMIRQLNLEKDKISLESEKIKLESETKESELIRLQQEGAIQEANIRNGQLEAERTQQALRLTAQQLESEKKERTLAELRQKEELERLKQQSLARQNEVLKKDKVLLTKDKNLLTQQQEIDRLELIQQESDLQTIYVFAAIGFLILLMILAGLFYSRSANQKLEKQNEQIENQKKEIEISHQEVEKEREKAEGILLNILPKETAQEIKENGAATPRNYEMVSVLFTDFSGFTTVSETMDTGELIEELNTCFVKFDEIIEAHHLEKIKTIGDAYMCAGGIPAANKTNPRDAVAAALAMQKYISHRRVAKEKEGKPYWDMRVGIHTGEVIAGVVGKKKFAYDIWGDTVNLASRMESSGEDGRINISDTTYQYVKDIYKCQYRGGIVAKNKGSVDMYFVEGRLS